MIGLGTLINTAAIIAGGLLGLLGGNLLKDNYREALMKASGVSVVFVGLAGALSKILVIKDGALDTYGSMMMIVSLAAGALIGEILDIEGMFERLGLWLRKKTNSEKDGGFINAFMVASLTVCIGAMAIVGAIQDGILGDYTTLAIKGLLDFVIIFVMAASMGKGAVFSAVPVFLLQGSVTLLARAIAPVMTEMAVLNLSLVGSVLIFCVGVNLLKPQSFKVANMLPAVVIAVLWTLF